MIEMKRVLKSAGLRRYSVTVSWVGGQSGAVVKARSKSAAERAALRKFKDKPGPAIDRIEDWGPA